MKATRGETRSAGSALEELARVTERRPRVTETPRAAGRRFFGSVKGWWTDPLDPRVTEALHSLHLQHHAGVPFPRSLRTAGAIPRSHLARSSFLRAAEAVEGGASFDDAMVRLSAVIAFPERAILSVGWSAGRLEPALKSVIDRRVALFRARKELRSRLMLPVLYIFATPFILNAPGMILGTTPPLSYLFRSLIPIGTLTLIVLAFKSFRLLTSRRHAGREMSAPVPSATPIDVLALRLPMVGMVQKWKNRGEFAATLSTLLGAGLSMLASLEICARALPNGVYRSHVMRAKKRIEKEGCSLAEALPPGDLWPLDWRASLESGYEAGEEERVLGRLGESGRERYLELVKLSGFWFGILFYLGVLLYGAYFVISFFMGYARMISGEGLELPLLE